MLISFLNSCIQKIKNIIFISSRVKKLESKIQDIDEKTEILCNITTDQTKLVGALSLIQHDIAAEIFLTKADDVRLKSEESKKLSVFIMDLNSDDDFIN